MKKYLDFKNDIDYSKLNDVALSIKNGNLAIFPTDTVYGIGANGLNEDAIKKLYIAKKRNFDKPINLLVSNINMIDQIAQDITEIEYKLMNAFFPGPFTIILKRNKKVIPNILASNKDTVGIRIPDCDITQKLIDLVGCPIATTSANISGESDNSNVNNLLNDFENSVDYLVDTGECKVGTPSTIVQVIDNVPHILRAGSITQAHIDNVLGSL